MNEIVVIQDSEEDAARLRHVFFRAGISNFIRSFSTGEAAMEYIDSTVATGLSIPSILFIELKLPGLTGFQVLEQIRKLPEFDNTLKIVITSGEEIQSIKRAYALGANSFIVKPPREAELIKLMRAYPQHWSVSADWKRGKKRGSRPLLFG